MSQAFSIKNKWIFILLIFSITSKGLLGQEIPYSFAHLTSNEGLLQNTVNCVTQDSFGYMWFGTYDGLQRFDGYNFESFVNELDDTTSISSNQIQALLFSKKGDLWVGTENGGLNIFNFETETFQHFIHNPNDTTSISSNHINHVFEDISGDLWISTRNGLNKFIDSTQTFLRFLITDSLESNFISQVHSTTPDVLWVATLGKGLLKFNSRTNTYKQFSTSLAQTLNNNNVWSVYDDSLTNKLWIGTEKGLNVWNFNTNSFEYYYYSDKDVKNSGMNVVRSIYPGLEHDIWIGSDGGGLYQLNHEKRIFRELKSNELSDNSLGSNSITSLFVDKDDNLWIGLVFSGVDRINLKQKPVFHIREEMEEGRSGLKNNIVNCIYKDSDDEFWFATEDGLARTKDLVNYQYYNEGLNYSKDINNSTLLTIYETINKDLWFGSYLGGISIYNKATDSFSHLEHEPGQKNSLSSNFVRSITEDKNGLFWIGSIRGGLDIYNPETKVFKNYSHLMHSDFVTKIIKDASNNMYVATYGAGVYMFSDDLKMKQHFRVSDSCSMPIVHNLVTSILFDADSNLWVGTANGLSKIDLLRQKSKHFTTENGLVDNVVYSIIDDNNQSIWTGTNKGLSELNTRTLEVRNFTKHDGFLSNQYRYNSVFKDDRGWLYFGGVNGVCYFNPIEISPDKDNIKIYFTTLLLFNKEVAIGEQINNQVILNQPLNDTKSLVLNHKNRMFTINFSSFSYHNLHKIEYAYKFEGIDEDWIDLGAENNVTFHNLPFGKYKLLVKGINNSTREDFDVRAINIEIRPPFYGTPFFKFSLILLIIGIIVLYYFIRLKILKKQKRFLEQSVHEKTVDLQETNTLLEEQQAELEMQSEELVVQKDFVQDQNKKISEQNKELELHRKDLEKLVEERTKELIKAKVTAEQADALKTAFLANMSHEIRTPMNAILGFIDLVDEPEYSVEDKNTFKKLIHKSGESLLTLINDIIDIAKIESGEISINRNNFHVGTLCRNLFTIYSQKLKDVNPDVELVYKCKEDYVVFFDEHRINQVMINLLDNALKFTDKGVVEFGYKIDEKSILFFVKDSGSGIEKEKQAFIFDRFRKLEPSDDKVYRGTGLGLAISKHLVELMGGRLSVDSEINEGSLFSFSLPKE